MFQQGLINIESGAMDSRLGFVNTINNLVNITELHVETRNPEIIFDNVKLSLIQVAHLA